MEFSLRVARPDDAAAFLDIYAPIVLHEATSFELAVPSQSEMAGRIAGVLARHHWIVAEDGHHSVLGYAYATGFRGRAAYDATCESTVYVAEGTRGQGIGRALMSELLAELESRRFESVVAGVALPNDASLALHRALDFEDVGTFRGVGKKFGRAHDVHFLQRRLASIT